MSWHILRVVFLLVVVLTAGQGVANADDHDPLQLHETIWGEVARAYNLDPYLLYSVALAESRRVWSDGLVRPWPWAVRFDNESVYAPDYETAVQIVGQRQQEVADVGLMQINHRIHRVTPTSLLDPKTNIWLGGEILAECIAAYPSNLVRGVGCYNAGHSKEKEERAIRYGRRVLRFHQQLKDLNS